MGKLKTKKGVAKRFRLTKKRKVAHSSGGKSHLATSKTTRRLRRLRRKKILGYSKRGKYLKRMLPYG